MSTLAKKKGEFKKLVDEIDALQTAHKGKDMPADVGTSIDAKAEEALGLQAEIDVEEKREQRVAGLRNFAGSIPNPTLPPENQPDAGVKDGAAGYLTIGEYVAASDGLKDFIAAGKPKGQVAVLAELPKSFGRRRGSGLFVPLSQKQVTELKAVPTIGANVIEPMRITEVARTTEQDKLRLRDILAIGNTTSNAVRYIRSTYTRAAASVAQGARKPEAGLTLESLVAIVRKLAVWIAVDDEQLDDFGELSRIINDELLYDLDKHEEEQVMYGDGTGEDFEGICVDTDVLAMRSVGGDTLIDIIRRGITDVAISGYESNGIAIHPLDWETIVLAKGTDNRYIFLNIQEGNTQRLHAVPVVATVAMADFQGDATEQRHVVVGDFRRGATLWDRNQSSVQVGWVNEQFIENQRTILAERRAAFAVRRPLAFRKHETQAAVVS